MSHYSVYVITPPGENLPDKDRINEILAPWRELDLSQEEASLDPRAEFTIEHAEESIESDYQKWFDEMLAEGEANPDDEFYGKYSTKEKILEAYPDARSWPEKWAGNCYVEGKGWGYWSNPIKKWDWFQIGGRYDDKIFTKTGAKPCNQALLKDIDWEKMRVHRYTQAANWWDEAQEKFKDMAVCSQDANRYFKYNIKKGQAREEYIKDWATGAMAPFAIVHNGKWDEKGEMGWWAIVSNEKDPGDWKKYGESIIQSLTPEHGITVVDCHI